MAAQLHIGGEDLSDGLKRMEDEDEKVGKESLLVAAI